MLKSVSVKYIANLVKGDVIGNANAQIYSMGSIDTAKEGEITFALGKEQFEKLEASLASCIIVPKEFDQPTKKTLIKTSDPREAFVHLMNAFNKPKQRKPGIHERAIVSKQAKIGRGVYIGPLAIIEEEVEIGDNTTIEAGVFIGRKSKIGSSTLIYPNVTIYHHCFIGNNIIIHSGTVIGADGFGFIKKDGIQIKVPQVGKVIIKDNVELGANVTVDRATIGETFINEGTKLDNQIQVGHNVRIGKNVIIAAFTGIGGSVVIEDNVIIAACVGIKDHVKIGKGAMIAAKSGVKDDIAPGQIIGGIPAKDGKIWAKEVAALSRLTKNINKIFQILKKN